MFLIEIKENSPNMIPDLTDLLNFHNAICKDLKQKNFMLALAEVTMSHTQGKFCLIFKGVYPENQETNNYLARMVNETLASLNLRDYLHVSLTHVDVMLGDQPIELRLFTPGDSKNSCLLSNFVDDKDIPSEFCCQLSNQVMDDPVYLKDQKDIFYEKQQIIFFLYTKGEMKNPYTTKPIMINDIVLDNVLKEKINHYVKEQVKIGLLKKQEDFRQKRENLINTIKKYASDLSQNSIDKAFRFAAAKNNLEDMVILSQKVSSINAQDSNPDRRRTALHWAIVKNSVECVKWLIRKNARVDIYDANSKTCLDYINKDTDREIIILVYGEESSLLEKMKSLQLNK